MQGAHLRLGQRRNCFAVRVRGGDRRAEAHMADRVFLAQQFPDVVDKAHIPVPAEIGRRAGLICVTQRHRRHDRRSGGFPQGLEGSRPERQNIAPIGRGALWKYDDVATGVERLGERRARPGEIAPRVAHDEDRALHARQLPKQRPAFHLAFRQKDQRMKARQRENIRP